MLIPHHKIFWHFHHPRSLITAIAKGFINGEVAKSVAASGTPGDGLIYFSIEGSLNFKVMSSFNGFYL
jgi:hypothetical protein